MNSVLISFIWSSVCAVTDSNLARNNCSCSRVLDTRTRSSAQAVYDVASFMENPIFFSLLVVILIVKPKGNEQK